MALAEITKVLAYITDHDRLLVFRQIGAPEAGIQVPSGTVEPGETLAAAAEREALEETGLPWLTMVGYLGHSRFDQTPFGRPEIHLRHFFHFTAPPEPPETWQHFEPDPSIEGELFPFEFFWTRMPNHVPELIGGRGVQLDALYQNLKLVEV